MPSLTISNLCKKFGETAVLKDVSFSVPDGAFLALLGPSGCGKTTLLRIIAGLEHPDTGSIKFDDEVVSSADYEKPPEERKLGMVFQSYALWPNMTVHGNIAFGLKIAGLSKSEREERIDEVLNVVGLSGFKTRRPHELSGGQRQRVALARSLAMRPRLILLDEPLANLDAHLRETMLAEFRRIHSLTGTTFIFVTHDQDEAMAVATHVAVMDQGKIEQVGTPEELYLRPATAMVARFIGRGRTVPVEVISSQNNLCTIRLADTLVEMPGNAPLGLGWLCFHTSDVIQNSDGFVKTELVNQVFQNGSYMSQCSPLNLDMQTISLCLSQRLPAGSSINLSITRGWVIPRGSVEEISDSLQITHTPLAQAA